MTEAPSSSTSSSDPSPSLLAHEEATDRPLCVEFDGTLIRTQTLHEAMLVLLRREPWLVLVLPLWVLRGRAALLSRVGERVALDARALPYRRELVASLRAGRAAGRRIILVAAHDKLAEAAAEHLGIFDAVVSDSEAASLERLRREVGEGAFDYIGSPRSERPLLEAAERGYVVDAPKGAAPSVGTKTIQVLSHRKSVLRALIKAMRPHQWAKNALVFLPVLLVPGLPDLGKIMTATLATAAFCFVASAGYVFNDLLDLDADRVHQTKHKRPLASGDLPVALGPPLFFGLIVLALVLSWYLPPAFSLMLVAYFVATLSYSFYLKSKLMVDVLVLAGLYTHRIFAGGIAASIPISAWLLAFSMFFFLSLAFAKRYVELLAATDKTVKLKSRGYAAGDLEMVASMGTGSGYIAVLVFSFYVDSDAVRVSYKVPSVLWLICPILLYWISRVWFLAHRGLMQDDPVKFAIKDRTSLACGAVIAAIAALARFWPAWLDFL